LRAAVAAAAADEVAVTLVVAEAAASAAAEEAVASAVTEEAVASAADVAVASAADVAVASAADEEVDLGEAEVAAAVEDHAVDAEADLASPPGRRRRSLMTVTRCCLLTRAECPRPALASQWFTLRQSVLCLYRSRSSILLNSTFLHKSRF
jgi:hypothetical protein